MKRPTNSVNTQHTSQQITEQPQKTHKKKCHSSILSYPQLTDPHFSFNLTSSPRSCWTLAWRWRGWNTWMEEYHQQMNKHCKMDVHIYIYVCVCIHIYKYIYVCVCVIICIYNYIHGYACLKLLTYRSWENIKEWIGMSHDLCLQGTADFDNSILGWAIGPRPIWTAIPYARWKMQNMWKPVANVRIYTKGAR